MFPSPSWDTSPLFTHKHVERAAWRISNGGGWRTRNRARPFWDGCCRLLSEHVQQDGTQGVRSQEEVGFLEEVTLRARVSPASLGGVGCREESLRELGA